MLVGIGRNSKERLEPVLKPNIFQWLEQSFDPPLTPSEPANNPGRLVLSRKKIQAWIDEGAKIVSSASAKKSFGPN